MNRKVFPFIALGLGLLIAVMLILGGALTGQLRIPLLAALLMSEFGVILNLAGVYLGYLELKENRTPALIMSMIGCLLAAAFFLWIGIELWPDNLAG